MIYITGDTHGISDFRKMLNPMLSKLTKDDFVIVVGDCGVLFVPQDAEYIVNLYTYLPYTVLFVDGNHENFELLNSYPVEMWHGGKVHRISDSVIHLMSGQVFQLEGKKFFTFGGAMSFDYKRRTKGVNWWPEEKPSKSEYDEAISNLQANEYQIDYVISHDCPTSWIGGVKESSKLMYEGYIDSLSNQYLEAFLEKISFRQWFFGHYHMDIELSPVATALYEKCVDLGGFLDAPIYKGKDFCGESSPWKKPERYAGKKVSILGDSLSSYEGFNPKGYKVHYAGHIRNESRVNSSFDTWWMQVVHSIDGVLCKNNSYAGSCVTPLTHANSTMLSRIKDLRESCEPDIILVAMGANDYGRELSITSKFNLFTFSAGYDRMLRRLRHNYPYADIWCSGIYTTKQIKIRKKDVDINKYNHYIIESTKKYGAHYIAAVLLDEKYTHDGLHPNREGMSIIAKKWVKAMLENQD